MKITKFICTVAAIGLFFSVDAQTNYQPTWESIAQHTEVPEWMRDAKFGIYCHWGVYSVPAYNNEQYPSKIHNKADYTHLNTAKRHAAIYGTLDKFDYHQFIPMFKAENFNADEWAELFQKAGARFAGPVAEHHDGFAMWNSKLTPFNAAKMGPKRDVVGELEKAIRKRGMKFFVSLHHEYNRQYFKLDSTDAGFNPKYQKLYGCTMPEEEWQQMWIDKCLEVIDRYHPDIIYHDAWLEEVNQDNLRSYLAYYFNNAEKNHREVIVTYKGEDIPAGGMLDYENSNPGIIKEKPFLCDYPIGTGYAYSWGYTEGMQLRTAEDIIHTLIEIVSSNGQMILNLSPKADGTIPTDQQDIVSQVGVWLWTNGEAIYKTRPYHQSFETLPDGKKVFYTQNKQLNTIYAITPEWIGGETSAPAFSFVLKELAAEKVDTIEVFGLKKLYPCSFEQTPEGLKINVPNKVRLPSEMAQVIRIKLAN